MRRKSLLDSFLESLISGDEKSGWYQKNLTAFLGVCDAHGKTAIQHHELLISKFIEAPATLDNTTKKADLTASGPPLPVLLKALKKLCDLRSAANVEGIPTRFDDLERLRASLDSQETTLSGAKR
jgi:hypothetical protein